MNEKVVVEVSGIRLEENSETPIMLLQDPKTFKFLPIWIGTIEAVSIAYAQEGFVHPRPQTHDLLIDIVDSLNASISEVCITDIQEKTYFAEITLNTLEGAYTPIELVRRNLLTLHLLAASIILNVNVTVGTKKLAGFLFVIKGDPLTPAK